MKSATYERISALIYDESGIRLRPGRVAMLSARLGKRIRQLGLSADEEYLELLERDLESEVVQLLDLISTNVTYFFREKEHFEFLASQYENWLAGGQKRFRFWCAASSTGEEPYSIAMTLRQVEERLGVEPDTRILASDISTRVLTHAEQGIYSDKNLECVPSEYLSRFFDKSRVENDSGACVSDELRKMLIFKRLNLSKLPFQMRGPLDVVFCRNVMLYFDEPVKKALVEAIHQLLRPGGFLIVGKSESVPALRDLYARVGPSIYQKA